MRKYIYIVKQFGEHMAKYISKDIFFAVLIINITLFENILCDDIFFDVYYFGVFGKKLKTLYAVFFCVKKNIDAFIS